MSDKYEVKSDKKLFCATPMPAVAAAIFVTHKRVKPQENVYIYKNDKLVVSHCPEVSSEPRAIVA